MFSQFAFLPDRYRHASKSDLPALDPIRRHSGQVDLLDSRHPSLAPACSVIVLLLPSIDPKRFCNNEPICTVLS